MPAIFCATALVGCAGGDTAANAPTATPAPVPLTTPAPTQAPSPAPVPSAAPVLSSVLPQNIASGASIALECGKEYRGHLNLTGLSNVSITTAGTCGKAVINAAQLVGGWQSQGGNIWSAPVGFAPRQVAMQGKLLELAHTPRTDGNPYLKIKSQSGTSLSLTGLQISGDVVGATVRVRNSQYTFFEGPVSAGSGDTITVPGIGSGLTNWGAYLEGKRWMLDEPGEWAYEKGVLYVYATNAPQSVEATDNVPVIEAKNINGLTLDNIVLKNGVSGLSARYANRITLRNVDIGNASEFGVDALCVNQINVGSTNINNIGRDGLSVGYCGDGLTVSNSTFTNIGTILMPRKSEAAIFGGKTTNMNVSGSTFTNSGYIAIRFFKDSVIDGNIIDGACLVLDDCGAIYTYDRARLGLNSRVSNNRISNVPGSMLGNGSDVSAFGIYLDDNTSGVTVSGNAVTGAHAGMQLHGAFANVVERNTFNSNSFAHIYFDDYGLAGSVRNNAIRYNNFGAGNTYQYGVQAGDDTSLWASYVGNVCASGAVGCK